MSVELPPLEEELAGKTRLGVLVISARYQNLISQTWDRIIENGWSVALQSELRSYEHRFDCVRDHYDLLWALDKVDDTKCNPYDTKRAQWIIWENVVNKLAHTLLPPHPAIRSHMLMSPYDPLPELPEVDETEWFLGHIEEVLPKILGNLPTPDGNYISAEEFMSTRVVRDAVEI